MLETEVDLPDICLTCMLKKPLRAKHCSHCNHCVARFDHHCSWLNNCIGAKNHLLFVILLITMIILHLAFVRIIYIALSSNPNSPSFLPLNISIPHYFLMEPLVTSMVFYHLLNLCWECTLIVSQFQGISVNMTTNERLNGQRYKYLKMGNPFDAGSMKSNFHDFLFNQTDWFNVFWIRNNRNAIL